MLRRIAVFCVLAAGLAVAGSAGARQRHHINAAPFSHEPCSVLSHHPCTPSFCSVLHRGPCIPEIDYPYGENLQLTVESKPPMADAPKYQRPDHDLESIGDLFAALRSCWTPPPAEAAKEGMQMTVRFSFKRSGDLIGRPRMTFATAGTPADVRKSYLKAINDSIEACVPLKFSGALGGAVAGRPIAIRYIDNRDIDKAAP
ncbi:hypothetical protein [Bradyrhizobium sp.]|uniref:hypothetical protein n=1 Tax=Bradyrhizobium sp. TaxID=376 RepID=UPI00238BF142|nr:hypothetical protein [Bradyrhizobium sp.]MDE1935524.1 hypothetical protein [Bradyrhizobium sp.]